MAILKRTERAMVRSMCGVNLVDKKNMMEMLGLKETLDRMAKANGVRWYGYVIRRDDDKILKKAMMLEVNGQRKRERPKMTWRRQVEESVKKVGLRVEETADRTRWREVVRAIAEGMRCIRPRSVTRKKPDRNWMMMMMNNHTFPMQNKRLEGRDILGFRNQQIWSKLQYFTIKMPKKKNNQYLDWLISDEETSVYFFKVKRLVQLHAGSIVMQYGSLLSIQLSC